jgi:hypothetical protein
LAAGATAAVRLNAAIAARIKCLIGKLLIQSGDMSGFRLGSWGLAAGGIILFRRMGFVRCMA